MVWPFVPEKTIFINITGKPLEIKGY